RRRGRSRPGSSGYPWVGERFVAAEHRLDRPALLGGQRPRLDDADPVADATAVGLVVRLVARAALAELVVALVAYEALGEHAHRLVHLVGHHPPVAPLAPGCRRRGSHRMPPGPAVRSRSSVLTRASARRVSRIFIGFGSCAVARFRRRWNTSPISSRSRFR